MPKQPEPPTPVRSRKEEVIDALSSAFARDDLTVEEFERRVDLAHRTSSVAELDALLADLPLITPPVPATSSQPALPPPPANIPKHETIGALMGGVERMGPWVPARRSLVLVLMGGVELDFREAGLGPGVTEITIFCAMGGVEIVVPPGVAVEASMVPIMGGLSHHPGPPPGPNAPVLRVNGVVIMGGVDVMVRLRGETAKDARRRQRTEHKEQKRLGRKGE